MDDLTQIDLQALEFLALGPDTPGVVNSEEVMCAHLFYLQLEKRGLVAKTLGEEGPTYSLTAKGRAVIEATPSRRRQALAELARMDADML